MKKIIGTAVLAVLAAGAVFAEPKITMKYRTRASVFTQNENAKEVKDSTMFNLKNEAAEDAFIATASNDYAGVDLELLYTANADAVKVDTYYAWLKFGGLTLTSGNFSSRFTNRYNVQKIQGIGLTDSDTAKYGISSLIMANCNTIGKNGEETENVALIGKDANNISALPGAKLSLFADYTFNDLPGKLLLKAGLIDYSYKSDETTTDDKKYQKAAYAFEAAYQTDMFTLDGVMKLPTEKSMVAGVYATLGMIPNAKAVLGFTYAKDDAGSDYDKGTKASIFGVTTKWSAFAIDGRLTYALSDAANFVLQGKFTSIKPDTDLNAKDENKAQTSLEAVAEISYIVNDLVSVALDGGIYMCDLDDNDGFKLGENYFQLCPAAMFTAGKGATLSAGLKYKQALGSDKADATATKVDGFKSSISIPVVLRVIL